MFSIGEFSKITGLTIKTLRFYHEEGLLLPSRVDEQTSYRHYAAAKLDSERAITALRDLGFSVTEIRKSSSTCTITDTRLRFPPARFTTRVRG